MINIVPAQETDVNKIRKLLCTVWTSTFQNVLPKNIVIEIPRAAYDTRLLQSQLRDPTTKFLIAKTSDSDIVGVINAKQDKDTLYINRLYSDRSFQRQGIGARLMTEITNYFPSAKKIILEVIEQNTHGINFYLKNGFAVSKKDQSKIGDVVLDVLVLQKEIR